MLTRCEKAYIAVPVHKLSVYLQPFRHSSFLECSLQPKFNKNPVFWKFRVYQSHQSSMLIRLKSSSLVLVVIGSIPMPICNRFHEKLANNGKITTFKEVPLFDALVHRFL